MDYILEKRYIIRTLFGYLGLNVENNVLLGQSYKFYFDNKILEVNDSFFSSLCCSETYLEKANIPDRITWIDSPWGEKEKIPGLYGKNEIILGDNYVYCGLDIFASAFFMLTRWEEFFLPKDKFGRCDEDEMFVVKHKIYHRAIVNEYIELLKKILHHLNVNIEDKERRFHPFITHDIDYLFRYASLKNITKNLIGDILHRKSMGIFLQTCKNYFCYQLGKRKDPFDTFDELMDLSDQYGFKNAFYFKASIAGEYDETYDINDKRVRNIIDNIVARGHEVGVHPSMNTFQNLEQFSLELKRLRSIYSEIYGGRQHFLLYDLPISLRAWNQNNLLYDAGLGFAFRGGFRCGICYDYPFFDVLLREELNLKIRPLIVMEGALLQKNDSVKMLSIILQEIYNLIDVVYKYQGEFVFLWHNDHFERYEYRKHAPLYKKVIDYLAVYCK